jgi:hypothetical protein
MIIVGAKCGGALEHRRGEGRVEIGEAGAAEKVMDIGGAWVELHGNTEMPHGTGMVAADGVRESDRREGLRRTRIEAAGRLAVQKRLSQVGR